VLSSGKDARFSLAEKTVQLRKKLVSQSRALGGLCKDYVTAPRKEVAMEMEASANEIKALLELIGPTQHCASDAV
jgi:Mg2+ and Co2+ transporter CorA